MNDRGQVLPIVMASLLFLIIVVSALVSWMQNDTKWTVKQQKSADAINLAEAGIDRGTWKLQSTTSTWAAAAAGTLINGYNFDTTYTDVPGGAYRIKFSSGPSTRQVTIWAEGRDLAKWETRSIKEVVQNQTIYSALMSGGNVSWSNGLGIYWGPIMSQGNIQLMDDVVASWYFPRKFAKGVVIGTAANPRDTNGLAPPNTDNVEWWTQYQGVPPLPVLDFVSLRSSAAATGTLNIYGCANSSCYGQNCATTPGPAPWDLQPSCNSTGGPHETHFGDSMNYVNTYLDPTKDYVWYWDGDVTLTGTFCGSSPCSPGQSTGLRGTVIVRGNLTIDTPGDWVYTGPVPANAWREENKLTINTFDTAATREYPADTGFHQNATTFRFGTDTWCQPLAPCGWYSTVGIRGFTYVGGNLAIRQFMDFNGAVWVNGTVTANGGDASHFCGIFYDDTLQVPALNVILIRQSWQEVAPSTTAWP